MWSIDLPDSKSRGVTCALTDDEACRERRDSGTALRHREDQDMLYIDKTILKTQFIQPKLPVEIIDAITATVGGLERTPIYHSGNQRVKPVALLLAAKQRVLSRIQNLGYGFKVNIDTDKSISERIPAISSNDRLDLHVQLMLGEDAYNIVVEFDATRADQVAKKFLSRAALLKDQNLIYMSFCYPGRKSMDRNEVLKYFEYQKTLSSSLGILCFMGLLPPRNWHK